METPVPNENPQHDDEQNNEPTQKVPDDGRSPDKRGGRRKALLIGIPIALIVLIAAAVLVPRIYADSQNAAAPAPLEYTPTAETGSEGADADPATLDGEWSVGDGSGAGYRIEEVLNGADVTVVGRTEEVTGDVTIADGELSAGTVEVDVASITTDSDRRDSYFREQGMNTEEYPTATFEITEPVALTGASSEELQVTGELTMAGQTKELTGTFERTTDGENQVVTGALDVTLSDFGLEAPDLGFVTVEPDGQVEFLLQLAR
ncbi:YceI family protein [Naumannella halotolerans]|uniref:YceI family protein n=1 Tax=Naumannella halotolerans TaxID=993414 RepID=UPI00105B6D6C|nr:YceI family protein [Naumannella halotolerans]